LHPALEAAHAVCNAWHRPMEL
jgi:hypothetical protein